MAETQRAIVQTHKLGHHFDLKEWYFVWFCFVERTLFSIHVGYLFSGGKIENFIVPSLVVFLLPGGAFLSSSRKIQLIVQIVPLIL